MNANKNNHPWKKKVDIFSPFNHLKKKKNSYTVKKPTKVGTNSGSAGAEAGRKSIEGLVFRQNQSEQGKGKKTCFFFNIFELLGGYFVSWKLPSWMRYLRKWNKEKRLRFSAFDLTQKKKKKKKEK